MRFLVRVLFLASSGGVALGAPAAWPGGTDITIASEEGEFGENLSGMYLNPGAMTGWAVQNSGVLYNLKLSSDGIWLSVESENWGQGKKLVYPDGTGQPDTEDITIAGTDYDQVYVCSERNDDSINSKISRLSILNYDVSSHLNSTTLVALHEWDVTAYLPKTEPNLGLEGITWVPDTYLTSHGFIDESTDSIYEPDNYPNHGSGLFFVGLEGNGKVYVFALDHSGNEQASLVTDFKTEQVTIMALDFDRDVQYLWTICDDMCNGQEEIYTIVNGKFTSQGIFSRPEGMKNYNNEGFTIASESACVNGHKPVYWTDDSDDLGLAIRGGTVKCGDFLSIYS